MDIKEIKKDLKKNNLTARLFMHNNLFITEDIRDDENKILELTGFSGSYAILVVTQNKGYLFVDGRYELQAKKQVNLSMIEIVKLTEISLCDWLKVNFSKANAKILFNPWELSIKDVFNLKAQLPKICFVPDYDGGKNLSDEKIKTFAHQNKYAGLSVKEKLEKVTKYLKQKKLNSYLITSASNVSWLFNLRSNALLYSPIFRGYALVNADATYKIFSDNGDIKGGEKIDALFEEIKDINKLGVDYSTAPFMVFEKKDDIINVKDVITELKAVKNKTELKGCIDAHIRDGVALTKFFYWLAKNYNNATELSVKEKLYNLRKAEKNFYSESFSTISAFGKNGAIVHYAPTKKSNASIKKGNLLLLDSGGQYFDGTTDVTRTVAIGLPSDEMIEKATLVLKAHIALAGAIFPENTLGSELDLLARNPLLKYNLDYEHGTGHGVGCFSNVHEGPHCISFKAKNSASLKKSMITSIEPGYYKENAFGVRIENLYYVKEKKNTKYLCFCPLTMVYIDKQLINKNLLTKEEEDWVNAYNKLVFNTLKKYLTKQELLWLKDKCAPL